MKKGLPRDTPRDVPAVNPGALIEAAELGPDPLRLGEEALVRARSVETLEVAYAAWVELQQAHRAAKKRWDDERKRLQEQGSLILGAVKAAGASGPAAEGDALQKTSALDAFVKDAQEKLESALRLLEERSVAAEKVFVAELKKVRDELRARVARQAVSVKPVFKLVIRVLGDDRRILHARKLGGDESVIALFTLTGRIPSRYEFLYDDSTDDVLAAPPSLYADEGATEVRPTAPALASELSSRAEVWPVKGVLPVTLPDGTWVRWISRGPVLEAEVREGDGFRNVLTSAEAERITGLLLAHKLSGKLELELVRE